jgi:hypothetical protein
LGKRCGALAIEMSPVGIQQLRTPGGNGIPVEHYDVWVAEYLVVYISVHLGLPLLWDLYR